MKTPIFAYFCHTCGPGAPGKIQHQYHPNFRCTGPIESFISIPSLVKFLEEKKFSTDDDGMNDPYECIVVDDLLTFLQTEESK